MRLKKIPDGHYFLVKLSVRMVDMLIKEMLRYLLLSLYSLSRLYLIVT